MRKGPVSSEPQSTSTPPALGGDKAVSSDTKRHRRGAGGRGASSRTEPARKLLEFPGSRRREKKQDTEVALGTVVRAHRF